MTKVVITFAQSEIKTIILAHLYLIISHEDNCTFREEIGPIGSSTIDDKTVTWIIEGDMLEKYKIAYAKPNSDFKFVIGYQNQTDNVGRVVLYDPIAQ